jgi:hypothetical protein
MQLGRTGIFLFLSLVFAALALVPAGAHLAELANKIDLAREPYFVVQQIYRGWALFGIVVIGALGSTAALTWALRREGRPFGLAALAFLCIVGTQAIFWTFTFPANRATVNWTSIPENWLALRAQWEYSHAASAVLNLIAFVALAALAARGLRTARPT